MNRSKIDAIADYVKSQSRNKVVFHRQDIPDLIPVNIGLRISETIYNIRESGKISMRVTVELANILNATISRHNVYGRYISIENLGILFEPKLKLNFSMLLESYSQNNVLFVRWDGEMYEDNLYFLTKKNGIKINIRNIGHIAI